MSALAELDAEMSALAHLRGSGWHVRGLAAGRRLQLFTRVAGRVDVTSPLPLPPYRPSRHDGGHQHGCKCANQAHGLGLVLDRLPLGNFRFLEFRQVWRLRRDRRRQGSHVIGFATCYRSTEMAHPRVAPLYELRPVHGGARGHLVEKTFKPTHIAQPAPGDKVPGGRA